MGQVEGMTQAISQLDTVLADLREYALGKGTQTEILDDTHVRITRAFDAPRHLIWRAHTEPDLMRKWLLGPDGWEMTVCELEPVAGTSYRYAWAPVGDTVGEPFGFEGENVVVEPERRLVSTERMSGTDYPGTVNDLSFDEVAGDRRRGEHSTSRIERPHHLGTRGRRGEGGQQHHADNDDGAAEE